MKQDVYNIITSRILEKVRETGNLPWEKPWQSFGFRNIHSNTGYRGINVFILHLLGMGETDFLTFNQAKAQGGKVKKGEKGKPVVFWKPMEKENKENGKIEKFFLCRYYTVFSVSQIEASEKEKWEAFLAKRERKIANHGELPGIETILAKFSELVPVTYGGNQACYSPGQNRIAMPAKGQFKSLSGFYSTLFHEIGHAMLPVMGGTHEGGFGSDPYAKEELIAEMFANFARSYFGIDNPKDEMNSAGYLQNWVSKLQGNSKWIVQGAQQSQKRFDKFLELVGLAKEETETETEEN